jgi:hypothetical protein
VPQCRGRRRAHVDALFEDKADKESLLPLDVIFAVVVLEVKNISSCNNHNCKLCVAFF